MTDTNASEAARTMRARRKHYDPAAVTPNPRIQPHLRHVAGFNRTSMV